MTLSPSANMTSTSRVPDWEIAIKNTFVEFTEPTVRDRSRQLRPLRSCSDIFESPRYSTEAVVEQCETVAEASPDAHVEVAPCTAGSRCPADSVQPVSVPDYDIPVKNTFVDFSESTMHHRSRKLRPVHSCPNDAEPCVVEYPRNSCVEASSVQGPQAGETCMPRAFAGATEIGSKAEVAPYNSGLISVNAPSHKVPSPSHAELIAMVQPLAALLHATGGPGGRAWRSRILEERSDDDNSSSSSDSSNDQNI